MLFGKLIVQFNTIFMFCYGWICPGVVNGDVGIVFFQRLDDVDHLGVAHVGTVFLEGESEHQYL